MSVTYFLFALRTILVYNKVCDENTRYSGKRKGDYQYVHNGRHPGSGYGSGTGDSG